MTFAQSAMSDLMMSANLQRGALFTRQPARSSFSPHLRRGKCGFQRLADPIDNRLRRASRYHDAEPRRHLRLGKALLRHGRHIGKVFRAAVVDRGDEFSMAPVCTCASAWLAERKVEVIRPLEISATICG